MLMKMATRLTSPDFLQTVASLHSFAPSGDVSLDFSATLCGILALDDCPARKSCLGLASQPALEFSRGKL